MFTEGFEKRALGSVGRQLAGVGIGAGIGGAMGYGMTEDPSMKIPNAIGTAAAGAYLGRGAGAVYHSIKGNASRSYSGYAQAAKSHKDHLKDLGLDIKKATSKSDIKKHYHTMAKQHHPDLGGNAETFKKMNNAMEGLEGSDFYKNLPDHDANAFKNGFRKAASGFDNSFSNIFGF